MVMILKRLMIVALIGFIILSLFSASVSAGSSNVNANNIKFIVKVNPQFFNIIVSDQKTVNDIKNFIQHSNNTQQAKRVLLDTVGSEVFAVKNMMKPFDVMFIDGNAVLVYTYNPNYVYESDSRLALPAVKLKASVPITVSKEFITKCSIYSKQGDNEKCHYTLLQKIKTTFVSDTVPKLIYSKEKINLNGRDIYTFVDSSGNVLIISPAKFNLGVVGSCNSTVIKDNNTDYKMFVCKSVDHIDFSKLPVGGFKAFITFNSDNTKVFKIDQMSYKVVTCLRDNVKIKKETLEADKIMTLYFEKIDCHNSGRTINWALITVIAVGGVSGLLIVWYLWFRGKSEDSDDIFE